MTGQEVTIRYYFQHLDQRNHFRDIEEDVTLLQLVQAHLMREPEFFIVEEINKWITELSTTIDDLILNARNVDEKCLALELKGHMLIALNPEKKPSEKIDKSLEIFREIIPLLIDAHTYSISRLFDQLSQILDMFIYYDSDEDAVEKVEIFILEIQEAASKTGRQHDTAHSLIGRGVIYLKKQNAKSFLKALELFHQSKALWNLDETREGFLLALLNISQIYAGLGMNLAAKYYGLCAVWASTQYGDAAIFKRISDGFNMVFNADFRQGSWISALDDYFQYINTRLEFRPESLDFEKDEQFRITSIEVAGLIAIIPIIHPELNVFIEVYKQRLTWVYNDRLKVMVDEFSTRFQDNEFVKLFIQANVSGTPLNDIGARRELRFKAIAIDFSLNFENTGQLNAVAEEFGALLYIMEMLTTLFRAKLTTGLADFELQQML